MGLLDLLFLALLLTAVLTIVTAVYFALRRQFGRSRRLFLRVLTGAAVYLTAVIAASLILPRGTLNIRDPKCFDDWCVAIAGFIRGSDGIRAIYTVDLDLFSRARRVSQREKNVAVYLTDNLGRRYNPLADAADTPFSVLLHPQESVRVRRRFAVPTDAAGIAAVIAHEGGFPIGWFIIGYDTWFRKPPVTPLR